MRELPSEDSRFENAERDIWQHMVNNHDWDQRYLYESRLGVLDCPDPQFFKFLETVVSPLTRSTVQEQHRFIDIINRRLDPVGFKLIPDTSRSEHYKVGLSKVTMISSLSAEADNATGRETSADKFEVVLSFAGEDREFVEQVAAILKASHVSLFYDRYQKATLWGKNLHEHLARVYGGDARYCVMFISKAYAEKVWTTHERRNAFAAAMERREEYVLPARFDDTRIEGLLPTIGYVDRRHETAESFAELILEKLGRSG